MSEHCDRTEDLAAREHDADRSSRPAYRSSRPGPRRCRNCPSRCAESHGAVDSGPPYRPAFPIERGMRVPYVRCPGCAMDTYSAAGHSTTDTCQRCGTPLTGGVRWWRVDGVVRVRKRVVRRPDAEPDPPPAAAAS